MLLFLAGGKLDPVNYKHGVDHLKIFVATVELCDSCGTDGIDATDSFGNG